MAEQPTSQQSTPDRSTPDQSAPQPPPPTHRRFNVLIGHKLGIGFGILIVITLVVITLNYVIGLETTRVIKTATELRAPVARASSNAQVDLLLMTSNIRGYLAFSEEHFLSSYYASESRFEKDIAALVELAPSFNETNHRRLQDLQNKFTEWQKLPEQLITLRNDQMLREPAYAWLKTTGHSLSTTVISHTNNLITIQAEREPSQRTNEILYELSKFQKSFAFLTAEIMNYAMTRDEGFFKQYQTEVAQNNLEWVTIESFKDDLTPEQQESLATIRTARSEYLSKINTKVLDVVESPQWRKDLDLFHISVIPLSQEMSRLLQEMATSQQQHLVDDLQHGHESLINARNINILGGIVATVISIATATILWIMIASPMRRLINIALDIGKGNFEVEAPIESSDEIGTFAATFNLMTQQVRRTLHDIETEKQRSEEMQQQVIQAQKALLHELSTPLFPVAERVVAMPLIGSVDTTRAQQMMDTMLHGVSRHRAKIAILDITGVPVIDSQVANALVQTAQAVRLLGTEVILTGIRTEVAQSLTDTGADLSRITTLNTIESGIAYAMAKITELYHNDETRYL